LQTCTNLIWIKPKLPLTDIEISVKILEKSKNKEGLKILLKVNWEQMKELNWKKIVTYSFGSLIAIIGICILVTVITLVLLQKFDDRYRNSHPEEFGMIPLQIQLFRNT
jgi:hypothetical protein